MSSQMIVCVNEERFRNLEGPYAGNSNQGSQNKLSQRALVWCSSAVVLIKPTIWYVAFRLHLYGISVIGPCIDVVIPFVGFQPRLYSW